LGISEGKFHEEEAAQAEERSQAEEAFQAEEAGAEVWCLLIAERTGG
jgi:hypothetical protein